MNVKVKYELKNGNILKDGHIMFLEDVVKDLQRKSHLEACVTMPEIYQNGLENWEYRYLDNNGKERSSGQFTTEKAANESLDKWAKLRLITKPRHWVNVDDDMPKDDSEVLVSFKDGSRVLCLDYNSEYYGQKGFWLNENGGEYQHDFTDQVSHWQYVPESATTPEGEHNYKWNDSVMQACEKCYMIRYPGSKPVQYRIFAKYIKKELPCDKQAQLDLTHDKIK